MKQAYSVIRNSSSWSKCVMRGAKSDIWAGGCQCLVTRTA